MVDLLERLQTALADRYAIESEIGRGGMAAVFLAEDLKHRRQVAIKVLHPEFAATLAAERFLNEIQIAAGLTHPHILTLHDSGEADGLLYYVMPYVTGESLRERLEREGELPVEEAVRIAVEVADGLEHAHEQGVIHRDVKPGNILLSGKHAVVADFGIARAVTAAQEGRMTGTGLGVGTPLYASPEQATGAETLDGRTDVYSLGCVLYELLTGEVPLTAATPQAVQARRLVETPALIHPQRETVPPLLDGVITKALARRPADRWESAEAFGQALLTATMEATPVAKLELAHALGAEAWETPPGKRSPGRWVLLAGAVAVIAAGVWLATKQTGWGTTRGGRGEAAVPVAGPVEAELPLQGRIDPNHTADGPFAISPDGEHLTYCTRDDENVSRLWLMSLDAPNVRQALLATGVVCYWVRWTPSGDRVLFGSQIDGHMGYWSVSRHGGTPVPFPCSQPADDSPLLDPRMSQLAPDESLVAHAIEHVREIHILPAGSCDFASANTIPIEGTYKYLFLLSWMRQPERILFATLEEGEQHVTFWTIRPDGRDRQKLARGNWGPNPKITRDGEFYFGRFLPSLQVLRVGVSESGKPDTEPAPVPHFVDHPVFWFSMNDAASRAVVERRDTRQRVVRVRPDPVRGSPSAVSDSLTGTLTPSRIYNKFEVSHDGKSLLYSERTLEGEDLFAVPIEGGTPRRLTYSGWAFEGKWSPDDRYVAYVSPWQDTVRLWLVSADGKSRGYVRGLEVSHWKGLSWEGPGLFYQSSDDQLEVLSDLQIEYGTMSGGRWTPIAGPDPEARTATFVVSGTHTRLTDGPEWYWAGDFPRGSPDGTRVAAVGFREDLSPYWWLFTGPDWSPEPLAPQSLDGGAIGWTADGTALYWREGDDVYLWPLDGGDRRLLLTLPAGLRDCEPGKIELAEIEFYCATYEYDSKLFLVENFKRGGA